jgi:imidazolonepropionase-like amidohydrolase
MLTRYGFTRAFDLAALDIQPLLQLRRRIDSGEVLGPKIHTVGVPMTPANPFYVEPLQLPVVRTAKQARDHVAKQASSGADGIKLWSASPTGKAIVSMDMALIRHAVAAAHRRKLPVFAHPTDLKGVAQAVAGGVDVLVHAAPEDRKDWPPAMLDKMLAQRIALIPTLKLYQWDLERNGHVSAGHPLLQTAIAQTRTFHRAGGTILFGTDVGFVNDYSPLAEYVLLEQAGLSFRDILASLTTAPAHVFNVKGKVAQVAAGHEADVVILRADPAADARNFGSVAYTIRAGQVIYRGEDRPAP